MIQAAADSRLVFLYFLLQAWWRLYMGLKQSVLTQGKGLLGMRNSSRICSSCTLVWWESSLSAGWKEDWPRNMEKARVHHWEIQFSRWKWKTSPTVRAAGLSLAAVTDSQNGWGWKKSLDIISHTPPAQAGPFITSYPGPYPTGFWLSPSMKSP